MQILFNGKSHEVEEDVKIPQILDLFQIEHRQVAVEVNLEIVPRDAFDRFVLKDGDRVEVVTLVGGG